MKEIHSRLGYVPAATIGVLIFVQPSLCMMIPTNLQPHLTINSCVKCQNVVPFTSNAKKSRPFFIVLSGCNRWFVTNNPARFQTE